MSCRTRVYFLHKFCIQTSQINNLDINKILPDVGGGGDGGSGGRGGRDIGGDAGSGGEPVNHSSNIIL